MSSPRTETTPRRRVHANVISWDSGGLSTDIEILTEGADPGRL